MDIALDMAGNLVEAAFADSNKHYTDPATGDSVLLCRGVIRKPYFARKSSLNFYSLENSMSPWHKALQSAFPPNTTEITFHYRHQFYRSDALLNSVEFEFQHSPMTSSEFRDRNAFYLSRPEITSIIWIFDLNDADITPLSENSFRYKRPRSTFLGFVPPQGDALPESTDLFGSTLSIETQRKLTHSHNIELFFDFNDSLHRILSCAPHPDQSALQLSRALSAQRLSWDTCDASSDFVGYRNNWSSFTTDTTHTYHIEDLISLVSRWGSDWATQNYSHSSISKTFD